MAALTYPIGVMPPRRLRVVAPMETNPSHFQAPSWSFQEPLGLTPTIASIDERRRRRAVLARRRRLTALVVSTVILLATWGMVGLLAGLQTSHLETLPGSHRVANGYVYTVRPGDTVWSIATRLNPSGDPRPLVAQIEASLHGASIVPGQQIRVP